MHIFFAFSFDSISRHLWVLLYYHRYKPRTLNWEEILHSGMSGFSWERWRLFLLWKDVLGQEADMCLCSMPSQSVCGGSSGVDWLVTGHKVYIVWCKSMYIKAQ